MILNVINCILQELQEKAREKVVWEIPLDADKIRPNFRLEEL